MTSRIPALLQPYIRLPPEASLILLTGVLGATTNWLTIRFLYAALGAPRPAAHASSQAAAQNEATGPTGHGTEKTNTGTEQTGADADVAVVLVSWLRDWAFWRTECRRAVGLDLARLAQNGRFVFVDGLNGVLSVPSATAQPRTPKSSPPSSNPRSTNAPAQLSEPSQPGRYTLPSLSLSHTTELLKRAISTLQTSSPPPKILLILDNPDLPLALSSPTDALTPQALLSGILSLRACVHSTIITAAADGPLIQNASGFGLGPVCGATPTPLEVNHAGFVVAVAHQASWVMGVRVLETGVARDVSGVLRVTVGDRDGEEVDGDGGGKGEGEMKGLVGREVLYFVGGDGGVRVFERGA